MITIVNSGGANITSIICALERLGHSAQLSDDVKRIKNSSHIILPGVGAAAAAMQQLRRLKLIETLQTLQQPVLGICLGMQLLFECSEEERVECLGIIPGEIKKLIGSPDKHIRVPHMGWNSLNIIKKNPLTEGIANYSYVYFVHGYAAPITPYTCASTQHAEAFSAIVHYKNFFATQFHPERSSRVGQQILKNFLAL